MNSSSRSRRGARVPFALASLGALLGLAACDSGASGPRATITETRLAPAAYAAPAPGMSLRERLGAGGVPAAAAESAPPQRPNFLYDLPAGWTALAPAPFRDVNLQHAEEPEAQLTVTMFPDRGGARGNIDRWRGQLGAAPMTNDEFAALETREVLGGEALLVDVSGSYTGMGAKAIIEDATLLGALAQVGEQTLFVKMIVPTAMAADQRPIFSAFLDSLGVAPPSASADPPPTGRVSPVVWASPAGWAEIPPTNQFREITFQRGDVEMYVSLARGDVRGNIERWAGQIGAPAVDEGAFAALPRVPSFGTEAVVYEASGSLLAMGARAPVPGQRLLGAIVAPARLGGDIVTLKMTGPDGAVAAAREDFMAVLRSLDRRTTSGPGQGGR